SWHVFLFLVLPHPVFELNRVNVLIHDSRSFRTISSNEFAWMRAVECRSGLPQFGLPRFFFMPIFTVQLRWSAPRWVRTSLENRNNIIARWPFAKSSTSIWTPFMLPSSSGMIRSYAASPSLSHGGAIVG